MEQASTMAKCTEPPIPYEYRLPEAHVTTTLCS